MTPADQLADTERPAALLDREQSPTTPFEDCPMCGQTVDQCVSELCAGYDASARTVTR